MHLLRQLLAVSAVSLGLLTAGAAGAASEDAWVPRAQRSRVAVEFDVGSSDFYSIGTAYSLTWGIVGQIKLAPGAYLDLDIPWAVLEYPLGLPPPSPRGTTFTMGNPTVGAHWAGKVSNRLAFHAGGTFTVSSRIVSREDTNPFGTESAVDVFRYLPLYGVIRMLHDAASRNRAYADLHRFSPDCVFLRGRGGLELRILPALYYRADLSAITAVPVGDMVHDTESILEVHNEIEGRASNGVGGGLHAQAVLFPTDNGDRAQTAIEPYFIYEPVRGFNARVGVLIALDEDLGFGLDEGKVATFRAALGGSW